MIYSARLCANWKLFKLLILSHFKSSNQSLFKLHIYFDRLLFCGQINVGLIRANTLTVPAEWPMEAPNNPFGGKYDFSQQSTGQIHRSSDHRYPALRAEGHENESQPGLSLSLMLWMRSISLTTDAQRSQPTCLAGRYWSDELADSDHVKPAM